MTEQAPAPEGRALVEVPIHIGAVFETGRNRPLFYDWEKREYIVPVLCVEKEMDRGAWILENMRVFSDGTLPSPEDKWKPVVDSWLSELRFAASRFDFDPEKYPDLTPTQRREKKREFLREVKETELDTKAMMAVSASARVMEVTAGSAAVYVEKITGGDSNLDKQDYWQDFLLHNDEDKLRRVLRHPLVRYYYRQIIEDAGIKLLEEGEKRWMGAWEVAPAEYIREGNRRFLKRSTLVRSLEKTQGEYKDYLVSKGEKTAYRGGLDEYASALALNDSEVFVEAWGRKGIGDGARWAAARLAADAFLVDKFTRWEYELDQRELEAQKGTDDEGKGMQLNPSPGWGGNPLRAVIEPAFLPDRIKKVYQGKDHVTLDLVNAAFRPLDVFRGGLKEKLLTPSMTTHLKRYARYSDALWTFLGSSRGIAIPQWTRDTTEKELPRIAEMLDQVYGNIDKPKPNTGKHIVGAMMARIIHCKALATAVESARPGFKDRMRTLFDPGSEIARPFFEIEKILWGPDLDAKKGLLASFVGGRTRFVFRNNSYRAEECLRDAWEILSTNDQDPAGRSVAKALNAAGFALDIIQILAVGGRKR